MGQRSPLRVLDKYPNQWIAIVNKKVVSHNSNLSKVKEIAKYNAHKKIIPTLFIDIDEHIYGIINANN